MATGISAAPTVTRAAGGQATSVSPNTPEFLAGTRMWTRPASVPLRNAMTCDVEDYFQVGAFEKLVPTARWNEYECRIARNVDRALELFAAAGVQGTFFTLGWVAARHPGVVRRIAAAGHEVASHGMQHVRVRAQQPEQFRADVTTSKKLLEDVSGQAVRGYRAASWSIDERTPWAHQILSEAGYEYSSSLFPISHDHYGVPNAPRQPFHIDSAGILEIPATTTRLAGRNIPAAGGGYFRLLPLRASLWLMRHALRTSGSPAVFYFHPWELDPEQPRMPGASATARFRHYLNLDKFERRLVALLGSFEWDRMDRVFGVGAQGAAR
jgi:polysaccharide deacetylase family protein (PEP-CTERM system associated)